MTRVKRRALDIAGRVGQHVPIQAVQLFSFIASPAVRAAPWPLYRRLHDAGGVLETKFNVTLVASHQDATTVLRHPQVSVREELAEDLPTSDRPSGPFDQLMDRTLLFVDPPDHARLRRLVSRAFTPKTVDRLQPHVEALVHQLIYDMRRNGRADLITELALPLPVAVICELLGVPPAERKRFLQWARHLAPRLDISLFRDPIKEEHGDRAAHELGRFLGELVDNAARRDPVGMISALVAVHEADDQLTRDETIALCALLLVAGFETTTNLIGNGLHALLRNPDQLDRVRTGDVDPHAMVDELLRFDGPVQLTQRVPLVAIDLDAHTLPARRLVAILVGAANRDPAVFDQPDHLDLGRSPNPHLAFSSGIHHCIGASLAKLEATVALPGLARELPNLRLAGTPRWRDTFVLRGLTTLPIEWHT